MTFKDRASQIVNLNLMKTLVDQQSLRQGALKEAKIVGTSMADSMCIEKSMRRPKTVYWQPRYDRTIQEWHGISWKGVIMTALISSKLYGKASKVDCQLGIVSNHSILIFNRVCYWGIRVGQTCPYKSSHKIIRWHNWARPTQRKR